MLADHRPQPLDPVAPDHEPELERPEAAAELNAPIAKLTTSGSCAVRRYSGAVWKASRPRVAHVVRRAVEVGQHPLVGVEDQAVGLSTPSNDGLSSGTIAAVPA